MFLFFGILKNIWLFVDMRIRIFLSFYNLVTGMTNYPTDFAKIAVTHCVNYAFLLSDPAYMK